MRRKISHSAEKVDLFIILLSIVINAFFAMSEIGVVSANKNHLQRQAEAGNKRARRALALIESPSRFLSTVQIGITFAGILGAIYGGAKVAQRIEPFMLELGKNWEWWQAHALTVCEGAVAFAIGVTSIVFGELIPKRLALYFPDQVAKGISGFMANLSVLASPLIFFLSATADGVLRLFGIKKSRESHISEDEVRVLVNQGMSTGVFHENERDMVEAVFDLDTVRAGNLMTPKSRMVWIDLADGEETNRRKIASTGHSDYPVCQNSEDKVLGMVSVKALWANLSLTGSAEIRHLLTEPLLVPVNMTGTRLLEVFKKERRRNALVQDEYGAVLGMVSVNDLLESIVGDLPGEMPQHDTPESVQEADGSWVLDGLMDIGDVKDELGIESFPADESGKYHTLAGFLLWQLGVVPQGGEKVEWDGFTFEILKMDRTRIDRVRVVPPTRKSSEFQAEVSSTQTE